MDLERRRSVARCSGSRVLTKGLSWRSRRAVGPPAVAWRLLFRICTLQQDTDPCAESATTCGISCHGVGSPASSSWLRLRGFDGEPHQKTARDSAGYMRFWGCTTGCLKVSTPSVGTVGQRLRWPGWMRQRNRTQGLQENYWHSSEGSRDWM